MRQNLDRLWREVYPGGGRASVDPAEIRCRVNSALDKPERRFYMRRQVYAAVICGALVLALAGTALAVCYRGTALTWFEGDTTLVEPAMQEMNEVLEGDGWRVCVDSALSDEHNTILGITMEALTEETREMLSGGTFYPLDAICVRPEEFPPTGLSLACKPDPSQEAEGMCSFSIRLEGVGAPNTLRIWFKSCPEKRMTLELTDRVKDLTVTAEPVSGEAEYFIRSCVLSPLGVTLEVEFPQSPKGYQAIDFCFRMVDGSLKTMSQLSGTMYKRSMSRMDDSSDQNVYQYTASYDSVLDPSDVAGVLMNGREYSFLAPEKVVPAEIPETMRPFRIPFVERDEAFYFSAADVCRHIGAAMERDSEAYVIRYLDRELVISGDLVLLNGEPAETSWQPLEEDGDLLLPREFFPMLGLSASFYYQEAGPEHAPDGWLVVP